LLLVSMFWSFPKPGAKHPGPVDLSSQFPRSWRLSNNLSSFYGNSKFSFPIDEKAASSAQHLSSSLPRRIKISYKMSPRNRGNPTDKANLSIVLDGIHLTVINNSSLLRLIVTSFTNNFDKDEGKECFAWTSWGGSHLLASCQYHFMCLPAKV